MPQTTRPVIPQRNRCQFLRHLLRCWAAHRNGRRRAHCRRKRPRHGSPRQAGPGGFADLKARGRCEQAHITDAHFRAGPHFLASTKTRPRLILDAGFGDDDFTATVDKQPAPTSWWMIALGSLGHGDGLICRSPFFAADCVTRRRNRKLDWEFGPLRRWHRADRRQLGPARR